MLLAFQAEHCHKTGDPVAVWEHAVVREPHLLLTSTCSQVCYVELMWVCGSVAALMMHSVQQTVLLQATC